MLPWYPDFGPNGHDSKKTPFQIPNGHHPKWTRSRMDTITLESVLYRTHASQMDTNPNEHKLEWTHISFEYLLWNT